MIRIMTNSVVRSFVMSSCDFLYSKVADSSSEEEEEIITRATYIEDERRCEPLVFCHSCIEVVVCEDQISLEVN